MSKREQILEDLIEALQEADLDQVYGIDTGLSQDKKYRWATFCRARTLDGEVRVYSPNWILFRTMKKWTDGEIHHRWTIPLLCHS